MAARSISNQSGPMEELTALPKTDLLYYHDSYETLFQARVLSLFELDGKRFVILDRTCFFPAGGGQPGDTGILEFDNSSITVTDTILAEDKVLHEVGVSTIIPLNKEVVGRIDWDRRHAHMRNHTASHVLFSAVRKEAGIRDLKYMGVQIGSEKSRIDISSERSLTGDELRRIEATANTAAIANYPVLCRFSNRKQAEEEYGDRLGVTDVTPGGIVRVVEIANWDIALCCGTHVRSTAGCVPIKLIGRERLQKGVERLEFSAGPPALRQLYNSVVRLEELARILGTSSDSLEPKIQGILEERAKLAKNLESVNEALAEFRAEKLLMTPESVGKFKMVVAELSSVDLETLRRLALKITSKDVSSVVILGARDRNVFLALAAGSEAVEKGVNLSDIAREAGQSLGGRGGGASKSAQAAGPQLDKFENVLEKCKEKIRELLEGT